MSNIRLTKEFKFEMAHVLLGYDGPCKNIHGHSYGLDVTVIGSPDDNTGSAKLGMVIDFGDLKKIVRDEIVDKFDHALVMNSKSSIDFINAVNKMDYELILVDYQPTSEKMIIDFAERIKMKLPSNIKLFSLRLRETGSSFAEWFASDND